MARHKNSNVPTSDIRKLEKTLSSLNTKIDKRLSFKSTFALGIVRGVGTAIGATIIAAIVFALLSQVVKTVDEVPVVRDILEETNLKEEIEGSR